MLVGNDVVDLEDPENQPEAIHTGWDSRVFTPEEQEIVSAALSPHRTRWRLWAAKESAFKLAKKIDPQLPFFPLSFAVEMRDHDSADVHHELGHFTVELKETSDYIHAVATKKGSAPARSRIGTLRLGAWSRPDEVPAERVVPTPARAASAQVRDLARAAIGGMLNLEPSALDISAGGGVPVASMGGVELPVDLSLSHHGRFVACAWKHNTTSDESVTEAED